jgi:hypothetical protein
MTIVLGIVRLAPGTNLVIFDDGETYLFEVLVGNVDGAVSRGRVRLDLEGVRTLDRALRGGAAARVPLADERAITIVPRTGRGVLVCVLDSDGVIAMWRLCSRARRRLSFVLEHVRSMALDHEFLSEAIADARAAVERATT